MSSTFHTPESCIPSPCIGSRWAGIAAPRRDSRHNRRDRSHVGTAYSGLTLIEMLVAVTASLLLLGTVMTLFQMVGDAVSKSRMGGAIDRQLCALRTTLLMDLAGVTALRGEDGLIVAPPNPRGYFCVVEGPDNDFRQYLGSGEWFYRNLDVPGPTRASDDRIVGDTDDMLFFTTQTITDSEFSGRYAGQINSAPIAEVAYFCRPTQTNGIAERDPQLYTLYRRQLLVTGLIDDPPFNNDTGNPGTVPLSNTTAPYLYNVPWLGWYGVWPPGSMQPGGPIPGFMHLFDVSVRREGDANSLNNRFVLNSLGDLGRRHYRFAHDWRLNATAVAAHHVTRLDPGNGALALAGERAGEDEIARNVLSFDVRVFDPLVPIHRELPNREIDLQPGDPGWKAPTGPDGERAARFVDLGYDPNPANPSNSLFSSHGRQFIGAGPAIHPLRANLTATGGVAESRKLASRTYDTWHPEQGIDPPYAAPLRSISITIRLYDRGTRRVRQVTVVHSFERN
jgi:hypothetical protein